MKKWILFLWLLTGCTQEKDREEPLFASLSEEETVFISLEEYGLTAVPKEITQLKKIKKLSISAIGSSKGWSIYPPHHVLIERMKSQPTQELPDEITQLTLLEDLALELLNLKTLPEDFDKLSNLESLDLGSNQLILSEEVDKLTQLNKLRFLTVEGNTVTEADLATLKQALPELTINPEKPNEYIAP
ncbi:leucine-rich repeat domain-containing protein [Robertkochia solimangrovi]|uniref:leucine-rich repeat domain-containing protein n=1 Tax=Robertkochia solimangrovi TaxID=2213046 RepID=UPI00117EF507|nr:leucine-rich repeat domain-containing protein [Robertkochia solimangrovi]TRZ46155.1 hypothetical protein DMZ48_02535 [Robertkochia solimangrovi]